MSRNSFLSIYETKLVLICNVKKQELQIVLGIESSAHYKMDKCIYRLSKYEEVYPIIQTHTNDS